MLSLSSFLGCNSETLNRSINPTNAYSSNFQECVNYSSARFHPLQTNSNLNNLDSKNSLTSHSSSRINFSYKCTLPIQSKSLKNSTSFKSNSYKNGKNVQGFYSLLERNSTSLSFRKHNRVVVSAFHGIPPSGEEKVLNSELIIEGEGKEEEEDVEEKKSVLSFFNNWQKRWTIVVLCFFAFLLCNMDRVNMSIAILPMSKEFGWTPSIVGLVQSSFFWGYILTQILGGILADRIGGKSVLGFGVIWWSMATLLTPIAAKMGLPALLFARACMGVGEGVAMPAMNNILSRWIPVEERSRSLALVYSGMYLGSVIGLAMSPGLIHTYGWPSCFYSFGSVGALWFTFWQRNAVSSPMEDSSLSLKEKKFIMAGNPSLKAKSDLVEKVPWKLLLSKAPVWAIIISHFCHNWGTFILLTWMPTYYHDVLGFNLADAGLFSVLPWLTMAIFANIGGWLADFLIGKGYSITLVRKLMQTIGFLGPAFCLTQLKGVTSPTLAVVCMMVSQGCDSFSQSGLYSNHQDIGPRYSGILLGISNTAGVLAGVLGTLVTGQILQNGSWDDVFGVSVVLYLVGTFVWNIWATGEKVFD